MARTSPRSLAMLRGACRDDLAAGTMPMPGVVLDLGDAAWAGVPCWRSAHHWATFTVPVAYAARYDTHVRPVMPGNPVSLHAVRAVAQARATYANHGTGRNSRPTNERLAADTGYSVRTVQRADTALRLLGVATEVFRGRQRTRAERYASWRVGDHGRGWASVWALHDNPLITRLIHRHTVSLSPHPAGSPVGGLTPCKNFLTTRPNSGQRAASRRASPDGRGLALARAWRSDPHAPRWVRRYAPSAWAAMLAGPAAHGWTPRDLNELITDWIGTGHRVPNRPRRPIGLLGAILAWHGRDNLDDRPAAADIAREAEQLAADRARIAEQLAQRHAPPPPVASIEHRCAAMDRIRAELTAARRRR